MVSIERGQELHGRACDGEVLTDSERVELESWYAEMDAEEERALNLPPSISPTNDELRSQIRDRMEEVKTTLDEIKQIEERNVELRRQNEELTRLLVAKGLLTAS